MTLETRKRIHKAYAIIVSLLAIVAGICFIVACCNIYYHGIATDAPQIYTREIVAESFSKIAIPVYLCLATTIGGMILNLVLPIEKAKCKAEKNLPALLQRLQQKVDWEACDLQLRNSLTAQRNLRKQLTTIAAVLLTAGGIVFLVYAANSNNWGSNSTTGMISAMYVLLGSLTIPFAYILFCNYVCHNSMAAEIALLRQAPKLSEAATPKKGTCRCGTILRIAILVVGAALIVLGACNEGTADILTKAVNICTECVGLG